MLDAISRAVHGRGYAVCVEGEPGIGKTALVDAVVTAAMTAHPTIQVVRAVGVESEFSLPHAGCSTCSLPCWTGCTIYPPDNGTR